MPIENKEVKQIKVETEINEAKEIEVKKTTLDENKENVSKILETIALNTINTSTTVETPTTTEEDEVHLFIKMYVSN